MKQPLLYEIVQFNLKVMFSGLFAMAVHIFWHITEYRKTVNMILLNDFQTSVKQMKTIREIERLGVRLNCACYDFVGRSEKSSLWAF